MKKVKCLWPYLKGSYSLCVLSLLFASLSVAAKMAIPFITGLAVDRLEGGDFDIGIHLILCLGLLLLGSVFRYFFDFCVSIIGNRVVKKMRDDLFAKYLHAPISYIDSKDHGDLIQRLIADMKARLELYAHLAQSQDDIKLGRVQPMDEAFDELFEEIGKAEL